MEYNISNTVAGDSRPTSLDYAVAPLNTDGISSQNETKHSNGKWSTYWAHFNDNPHLKNAILLRSIWNVGKGYITDTETQVDLDHISGWGKDTFDDILYNMDVVASIGGDSYAEIIWDDKEEIALNLKPLDPASIDHILNNQGILIRYEQHSKIGDKTEIIKFKPKNILHFSLDRLADQIHGLSVIPAMEKMLLSTAENFDDISKVMHRQAKPLIMFKLKTDNSTKIEQFKTKMQEAMRKSTDNIIYIPDDENVVSYEVVQINPSPLLLEWKNALRKDFYSTVGSPELLSDSSGSTESGGKVGYLTFQQVVEKRQRYIEKQLFKQLKIKLNLIAPASIEPNLQEDENKDTQNALTFQPSDTQAGVGR